MIHPQALVDDVTAIGPNTNVWAFAHIMKGATVGSDCNIGDHAFLESGAKIGNNVTVKNRVMIWEGVTIRDDVFLGPGVVFTNDRNPRSPRMPQARERYADRSNWLVMTLVDQGCSIGAGAIICPGLTLGKYSMIGAGSVVTKNVEPYSLVAGTPATHRGYVCSCGQKLAGHYKDSRCEHCGEQGSQRDSE
jgi:acetyltransferase-like isoleucine patch superfamily enzyme